MQDCPALNPPYAWEFTALTVWFFWVPKESYGQAKRT